MIWSENEASPFLFPPAPLVFVGGADVNKITGWPLEAGETLMLEVSDSGQLYAVVKDGAKPVDLRTLEIA